MNHQKDRKLTAIRLVIILFILPALLIAWTPLSHLSHAASRKEQEAKSELAKIRNQLASVKADRQKLASKEKDLSGNLAYLKSRSEKQRRLYDEALEQKQVALETLEMSQEAYLLAKEDFDKKLKQYQERMGLMFAWNNRSFFEILLSADSLQGLFTTIRFMKFISDADEQMLEELETASHLAEQMEREAEEHYGSTMELVKEADAVMREIESQASMTEAELKRVSGQLALTKAKQDELVAAEKSAAAAAEAARREAEASQGNNSNSTGGSGGNSHSSSSGKAKWVGTGRYTWPVPSSYYISSGFGWRAKYGRFHYGTDIAAPVGTPIVAADDGIVRHVGWGVGSYGAAYGKLVIIDHSDGHQTRYAHLNAYCVKSGQKVKKGQRIAYMGNTGRSSGPHLHFEIRIYGIAKNPLNYYKKVR